MAFLFEEKKKSANENLSGALPRAADMPDKRVRQSAPTPQKRMLMERISLFRTIPEEPDTNRSWTALRSISVMQRIILIV